MSSIQLSGLSTGIDTQALVAKLIEVERNRLVLMEKNKDAEVETKNALDTLENKCSALKNAVNALSDASELRCFSATTSDEDLLTASASFNAFEGNHSVVVNQLANAERWIHSSGVEYTEDYVGEGNFIYSYNDQETVITTTTETTLEELVDMINNDANNPGVTASTLYYDDKYHLVLNGNDAGGDYEISVNTSNTEILKSDSLFTADSDNATLSTKFTELDQFEGTLAGDEYITISGKTHDGTAFSQDFYINEYMTLNHLVGEIDDAFGETASAKLENGEIIVSDNTCGSSQMELSLAYNAGSGVTTFTMPTITQSVAGGSVSASLSGFGESDFAETQSAQDCQIKVDGFPGGEDDWIERSSNTIDDVISGVTLNLHDTGSVQVNMTRDIESIKENLNELVTAYNDVKNYIQENTSYDKTTKEAGLLMGDYIVSTIESQLRVPLINSAGGFQEDIETFLMPGQIGFSLDRDGLLEFDSIVFDQAIADDYMGVLSLIGADKTGSSDSNTIEFYGASSKYTTAGTYEVEVVITGGVITSAMIKHEDDTQWHEAEIDGNIITGAGGFDDNGNPLYAENSLQLTVDLSQSGTFDGSVRVKQGFAGAMEDSLDAILKTTTGALDVDEKHLEDIINNIQDKIDNEEDRLETYEERLVARYARLEKMLTLLQNQMSALNM